MKNKGFTLVELLGVILIIGLLASLIYPTVNTIIVKSRTRANNAQKDLIIEAAKLWSSDNSSELSDAEGSIYMLKLLDLQKGGYLKNIDIKNLENDTTIQVATSCVEITTTSTKFKYELVENCG